MYFKDKFLSKIFRIGILFSALLVLTDLFTFLYFPDAAISKIFLATREQTPLTWVSAVVLLLIALSAATRYFETKNKLWYIVSLIFFFLSIDDAVYFHERFSAAVQKTIPILNSFPSYSWVIIYMPIVAFGFATLTYLLWKEISTKHKQYLIASLIMLVFSLALDMVDGWVIKDKTLVFCYDPNCDSLITHLFRLTEETIEVVSVGLFAYISSSRNIKKM